MKLPIAGSLVAAAIAAAAGISGCGHAIAHEHPENRAMNTSEPIADLRFETHNFSAYCFNTIGCTVIYNHRYQIEDGSDQISGPPPADDYRKRFGGGETGVPNFPKPVQIRWKSMDGVPHEAEVDVGKIFHGGKILHRVPAGEIAKDWVPQDLQPDVYLEVNDRTIRVFMKAHVPTEHLQVPGNRFTNFRAEVIEAWSHTY